MNKALPILFLWDREYKAYCPNTYCQISLNSILMNDKLTCDNFPKSILWVGRWWTSYSDSWYNNVRYIKEKELQHGNIIGTLVHV